MRVTARSVLPGIMPPLNDADARTAAWWRRYWAGPVAKDGSSGLDFEQRAWRAYAVDGEVFIGRHESGEIELISPDECEPETLGGDTSAPVALVWRVRGKAILSSDLHHVANRHDLADPRGRSMMATALPASRSRLSISSNAGGGAAIMARIVGIYQTGAGAGLAGLAGAEGLGVSGLDVDAAPGDPTAAAVKQFPAGSLPSLPPGASIEQHRYGMPEQAGSQIDALVDEIAAGLGVSRHALDGDLSRANFNSLRVGFVRDNNTFAEWCDRWCRHFRLPIWRAAIVGAIADGEVPAHAMRFVPEWAPPYRRDPMEERAIKTLGDAAALGLVDLRRERVRRGLSPDQPQINNQ